MMRPKTPKCANRRECVIAQRHEADALYSEKMCSLKSNAVVSASGIPKMSKKISQICTGRVDSIDV